VVEKRTWNNIHFRTSKPEDSRILIIVNPSETVYSRILPPDPFYKS
jgi:hypothetical protein